MKSTISTASGWPLTPHEYYLYCVSGIYPCPEYYGVKASDVISLEKAIKHDIDKREEKARKNEPAIHGSPSLHVCLRRILSRLRWPIIRDSPRRSTGLRFQSDAISQKLAFYTAVLAQNEKATEYLRSLEPGRTCSSRIRPTGRHVLSCSTSMTCAACSGSSLASNVSLRFIPHIILIQCFHSMSSWNTHIP